VGAGEGPGAAGDRRATRKRNSARIGRVRAGTAFASCEHDRPDRTFQNRRAAEGNARLTGEHPVPRAGQSACSDQSSSARHGRAARGCCAADFSGRIAPVGRRECVASCRDRDWADRQCRHRDRDQRSERPRPAATSTRPPSQRSGSAFDKDRRRNAGAMHTNNPAVRRLDSQCLTPIN